MDGTGIDVWGAYNNYSCLNLFDSSHYTIFLSTDLLFEIMS